MMPTWKIASNYVCDLGEGPVWDPVESCIYWIDIDNCAILKLFPGSGEISRYSTGSKIGCFALRERGGIIAALEDGIYLMDLETGSKEIIASPVESIPGNRFNDGKCDPAGRFWAGTMSMIGGKGTGSLYCTGENRVVDKVLSPVSCSNGLAWNKDATLFYYIDTPTRQLSGFDYDNTKGKICNKRILSTFADTDGFPDGMTIDAEGMLWIAFWNGWKVMRVDPKTGKTIQQIQLPVSRITSCTFGGKDLTDLYITTAKTGLSTADLEKQPMAGALFVIEDCGFSGIQAVKYTG